MNADLLKNRLAAWLALPVGALVSLAFAPFNWWPLGILGTAALSIGARAPFGSSDTFQPTLPQEFGRDVAGGVNQAGRDVLKRELQVTPTITVAAKDEVTLEVLENISLLTDPIVVTK